MATTEFKLPELGENVHEAEVIRLLVAEGDEVKADRNVMEVESDKASMPLPCTVAGKVAKVHVKEGDTIKVGQTLLTIEEKEGAAPSQEEKATPGRTTGATGERTKKGQAEAKKERPAKKKAAPAGQGDGKAEGGAEKAPAPKPRPKQERREPVPAGPAARRLAREMEVELEQVEGTGPHGLITQDDVRRSAAGPQHPVGEEAPPLPDFARWGPVERRQLNSIGRATAERVSAAWRLIPHVAQHEWAEITELEEARRGHERERKEEEPKVTLTVLVLRAAVAALKAFPQFNSSFDPSTNELIVKQYYHVGVAVDTERGLLVPVVRDADRRSTAELAAELAALAEKARKRSLSRDEMEGGTFTVTNLGGIAGSSFAPIINYPEVAILGVGRARWQSVPRSREDHGENRLLLPLSLSYDHRVINGADGARFIAKVAELLSGPFELLSET
jgi:pyruvate dehydrogenase E2 component (dihydrolipoamide acetyltransferase)